MERENKYRHNKDRKNIDGQHIGRNETFIIYIRKRKLNFKNEHSGVAQLSKEPYSLSS